MILNKLKTITAAAMLLTSTASYGGVNVIVQQVGSDVVVTGGGFLNTSLWTLDQEDFANASTLSDEALIIGAPGLTDLFISPAGFNGPEYVTASNPPLPDSGTGPIFGIESSGALVIPANSGGGGLGFSSATFNNRQIADLTLTADKLHWDWDTTNGLDDFFNIVVNRGPSASNITYQIIADPGLSNGYGFSGTITTDGTLGDFQHGDALPIIDWNLHLMTPDENDGVAERTLTPLNSYLRHESNGELINFTPTQVIIQNPGSGIGSSLFFINNEDSNQEWLHFTAGNERADYHVITMADGSEAIDYTQYLDLTSGGFVIANVVPEPTSLALLGLGGLLLVSRRRV